MREAEVYEGVSRIQLGLIIAWLHKSSLDPRNKRIFDGMRQILAARTQLFSCWYLP